MAITVILADDHLVLRESLAEVLDRDQEIQVIGQANDGNQLIELCRQLEPQIVLMDIHMPVLNGVEAARRIKHDLPQVQVIMLSMYASKEHIFQAFQAGARGYLLKETSVSEVIDAIKEVAAGRRHISQSLADKVIDDYILQRGRESSQSPLEMLSSRERQIMQLVTEGQTSKEIAELLHLSISTVSTYRSRLMKKLGVKDLAELVKLAVDLGLTDNF